MSSRPTIHSIAPAAKPSPTGRNGRKTCTNRKAGRAISGCGRLDTMLHPPACHTDTSRGTSTRLIASPSGMLWTAIAIVMNNPSVSPSPYDTPTPTPSLNECAVIIPTTMRACIASAPRRRPTAKSVCPPRKYRLRAMPTIPAKTPILTRPRPYAAPSYSSIALAAVMRPAAAPFASPRLRREMSLTKKNGRAPSPVATAVRAAANVTV